MNPLDSPFVGRNPVPAGPTAGYPPDIREYAQLAGDEAERCYSEMCQKIKADIDAALSGPASIWRNAEATIIGQIDLLLDEAERKYLKAYTRAVEGVNESLGAAYFLANQSGVPTPSDIAVKVGNQSGEQLRSCWLNECDGQITNDGYPADILGPDPFGVAQIVPAEIPVRKPPICPTQPSGYPRQYPFEVQDLRNPYVAPHAADFIAWYEWVYSLGPPWVPQYRSNEPSVGDPCNGAPGCMSHPNRRWTAVAMGWLDCSPTPTPTPSPPVPPPSPPIPDPTPTPFPSCPVPEPTGTQCQIDTAVELFGVPYAQCTTKQKEVIDCYCGETKKEDASKTPPTKVGSAYTPPRLKLPNWCSPEVTADLFAWQSITADPAEWLRQVLQIPPQKPDETVLPPWLGFLKQDWIANWIPATVLAMVEGLIDGSSYVTKSMGQSLGKDTTSNLFTETAYAVLSLLNKYLGFPPGSWLRSLEKTINWQGPEGIPSAGEALEGYLSGAWSILRAEAYVKANNFCWEPMRELMEQRRTKPNIGECTQLYMQEKITEAEWRQRMRESGVIRDDEMDLYRQLVDSYPQPPDLIRFMLRDATDDDIARKYKYDKGFDDKWQGLILKYAKAVGLNEQEARYYWRAHWEIPSNTQLFEMLHRLRPGAVPKEIEVTYDDVKEAIQVNDLAPFWVDRIMATSYNPLTRTDAMQALFVGSMDAKRFKSAMMDVGYTEKDADELTKYALAVKRKRVASQAGLPGPKEWLSDYANGLTSAAEVRLKLSDMGWERETIDAGLQGAIAKRERTLIKAEIASIRRQFLGGAIDRIEAEGAALRQGLSPMETDYLIALWSAEQRGKSKLLTGAQLCKAWERGLMSPAEYQERLWRAGYSTKEAAIIMTECGAVVGEKQMRKAEAEQRKVEQAEEKAKREMERERKRKCRADKARRDGKPTPCD